MMQTLMLMCTFIVVGFAINGLTTLLNSNFLCKFLDQNLLVVLIALLAINTTTNSVVLTKMREIADKHSEADFKHTRKAMKKASMEQLGIIIMTVVFQIVKTSPLLVSNIPYIVFIIDSLLIAVFAFSIQILFDTARGVYVILDSDT